MNDIKKKADIGVIGMAVMGQNLALNIESRGYTVAVYNRTQRTLEDFVKKAGKDKQLIQSTSIENFVGELIRPRKILLMVKAGEAVDRVISDITPHLDAGDIIIDGGNSFFEDTIRRAKQVQARDLLYIGTGVSGGEEGALTGPSIMPGGDISAYAKVEKILSDISAKVNNEPCCKFIGSDGAGHYVKMIHNGIEYGDMQLISEAYSFMKNGLAMDNNEMHDVFKEWNHDELDSYLIEITADILSKTDTETNNPLVEIILDKAGHKGTGKWTSESALSLGFPAPTICEAVFARYISSLKTERSQAATILNGPIVNFSGDKKEFLNALKTALYASKICSYAQGFGLMQSAARAYQWELNYGEISMIWRGGCIIRAKFLSKIKEAYDRKPDLPNLLLDPYFSNIIETGQEAWRKVVSKAALLGIPVPAFSSALNYFDSYRSASLSANMIQAQRDYFGAHTYERVDRKGVFHTEWLLGDKPPTRKIDN